MKKLMGVLHDLSCVQNEVELFPSILNTRPLIVGQATKADVVKRVSSVAFDLIHIAAYGNKLTGETVLSPNPVWNS